MKREVLTFSVKGSNLLPERFEPLKKRDRYFTTIILVTTLSFASGVADKTR